MPFIRSVVSFDDSERQTLAGDGKVRSEAASSVTKAFSKQIKDVFTKAAKLADTNPSHAELLELSGEIDGVRTVLNVLPDSDLSSELAAALDNIEQVVSSALRMVEAA